MSALIWKSFELYFQLTKVLLPFPYALDLTAKKLHYYKPTPLLTSKYFAWYCYGSLATSSLFFHSLLGLGLSQLGGTIRKSTLVDIFANRHSIMHGIKLFPCIL
jgi:hypothetical protein